MTISIVTATYVIAVVTAHIVVKTIEIVTTTILFWWGRLYWQIVLLRQQSHFLPGSKSFVSRLLRRRQSQIMTGEIIFSVRWVQDCITIKRDERIHNYVVASLFWSDFFNGVWWAVAVVFVGTDSVLVVRGVDVVLLLEEPFFVAFLESK